MTDIVWGDPIEVNGVRPEWLRDDTHVDLLSSDRRRWYSESASGLGVGTEHIGWRNVESIRLPANHAYYLAASRGFTYWPGGDSAPADWDGGEVLIGDGRIEHPGNSSWAGHYSNWCRLIGYRKRAEQPAIAPELVERMVALLKRFDNGPIAGLEAERVAILAELEPDPDLTLAKSIMGDAGAIALAIKAARENGRG